MRGYYTLERLAHVVHHRGVRLVEIVESALAKYLGKYIAHGKVLIHL